MYITLHILPMKVVVIFPVIFLADRKLSQLMESVHNWESCVLFVDTAVFLQITTKIKTIYPPDQILTPLTCTMYAVKHHVVMFRTICRSNITDIH